MNDVDPVDWTNVVRGVASLAVAGGVYFILSRFGIGGWPEAALSAAVIVLILLGIAAILVGFGEE